MNNYVTSINNLFFYGLPVPDNVQASWVNSTIHVTWNENYTPDIFFQIWSRVNNSYDILLGITPLGASSFSCLGDFTLHHSIYIVAFNDNGFSGKSKQIHLPYLLENNLPEVNTDSLGTASGNTPYQNSLIINNAITSGLYSKIIIGSNSLDIYLISQPILPNNCEIVVKCILKIMDSVVDPVAVNVVLNDTTVTVNDATKFHLGEYVAISDDVQFVEFGKHWGWSGKITNIVGNVITLDTIAPSNYTLADNAYIGTLQSVILIDTVSKNIISCDGGYIDGNKAGQILVHPTYKATNGTIVEAYKAGCGISVWKSLYTHIKDDVVVKNASMHGISFSSDFTGYLNQYIKLGSFKIYNSCEKGVHLKWSSNGFVDSPYIENCQYQDGFIFYSTNDNWFCGDITTNGCGRAGVSWNSTGNNCNINSVFAFNCTGYGLNISTNGINIKTVYLSNTRLRITNAVTGVNGVNIETLYIFNTVLPIGDPIALLQGNIKNINIQKMILSGNTGIGLQTLSFGGLFPESCVIYSGGVYNHTGLKKDIAVGTDIQLVGNW
jgi:hypothetical protein